MSARRSVSRIFPRPPPLLFLFFLIAILETGTSPLSLIKGSIRQRRQSPWLGLLRVAIPPQGGVTPITEWLDPRYAAEVEATGRDSRGVDLLHHSRSLKSRFKDMCNQVNGAVGEA
ncbi:hypothetical protein LX32DRAFT_109441 [Colletotrichum zoysiae]|uniref:Uncharacterized protein n=1 Tax=Colletotrichum zoysiae TaxID=1216348 RepID=A0AAD9M063_9PEZI|nr:hypothetical protein LX32DRAFT_109441 [Colletotrichum zoysiae]